jgi:hypothetical protein
MVYTTTDIEKIMNHSSWSVKRKTDYLLHKDCNMYANLGLDSSKKDRKEVRIASKRIYTAIKSLNSELGTLLLHAMDDK